MSRIISVAAFGILIAATIISFSNTWIATDINAWQVKNNNGKYYPALTVFVLSIPPLVILVLIKLLLEKKRKPET